MYGINTILYQRGLYPPETFTRKQEYGITLLVTTDEKLKKYLSDVLGQVKGIYMKHKQFFNTFLLYLLTTSILSLIFSTPKFQTLLFLSSLGQGLWRCPRCSSVRLINPPSIAITWKVSHVSILSKFVMHVTNKQFSDKFNKGWKKFKMADLLWFWALYVNN